MDQAAIGYLGITLAVVSILASVAFFLKSRERKKPTLYYLTYREIAKVSNRPVSPITIQYQEKAVDRVFTSYLWFWNAGRRAVKEADIQGGLVLEPQQMDEQQDVTILDFTIIRKSRDAVGVEVSRVGPASLGCSFEFLDHRDGFLLEVQHTGTHDTPWTAEGVVIGCPHGVKVMKGSPHPRREFSSEGVRFKRAPFWMRMLLFCVPVLMILVFAAVTLVLFHTTVTIHPSRLLPILSSELPTLAPEQLTSLVQSITKSRSLIDHVGVYALPLISAILLVAIIIRAWRRRHPYPRSIGAFGG